VKRFPNLLLTKRNVRPKLYSKQGLLFFIIVFAVVGHYFVFSSNASPSLSSDINNDNIVNILDLSLLLSSYGRSSAPCATNINYSCDLNSDSKVNIIDLSTLLSKWGSTGTQTPQIILNKEAEQATLGSGVNIINDSSLSGGQAIQYDWGSPATFVVDLPSDSSGFTLKVKGDQCDGAPNYSITIDGSQFSTDTVSETTWTTKTYSKYLLAGRHTVVVQFTNDYFTFTPTFCNRNLYLDNIVFSYNSAVPTPSNPAIPSGFVHQSGTKILNGSNQQIKLRGVNLGGYLSWEGWMWGQGFDYVGQTAILNNLASLVGQAATDQFRMDVYNNYITDADFKALSAYGINSARLPFNYRMLEDDANPGVYKQSGWTVLDNLVNAAKANNVYLILDMQVAPCSQAIFFTHDYVSYPDLWGSSACQDRAVNLWKTIAQRYANQNIVAGYDLLGEPTASDTALRGMYQHITAAIRQVDTNHLLIYEGNGASLSFTAFTAPFDSNMMISPHDYIWEEPSGNISGNFTVYDAVATAFNCPIWIGEFGQAVQSTLQQQIDVYESDPLVVGWEDWTYKQSPGFPSLTTIQHTPQSQKLIYWINNTTRPQPTLAEAQQGMADFINAIKFVNNTQNAQMAALISQQ
jgi:hypothetical protein